MNEKTPTTLQPYNPTEMLLGWNEGERFTLPYTELRYLCPCAHCVDEHTGKRVLKRESIAKDIRVVGVEPVGRYAVQLNWSDGHKTGIYAYDRLWDTCTQIGKRL